MGVINETIMVSFIQFLYNVLTYVLDDCRNSLSATHWM